jgi:hypothetical protein
MAVQLRKLWQWKMLAPIDLNFHDWNLIQILGGLVQG